MTIEHIENERCCGNCRHFYEGECRRYPPQVGCDSACEHTGNVFYAFPRVYAKEWCGEFQSKEGWILPKGWQLKNMPDGPGGLCEVQTDG